jgi:hypothetical protein
MSGWACEAGAFRLTGKFVMGFLTPFTGTTLHVRLRRAEYGFLGRMEPR